MIRPLIVFMTLPAMGVPIRASFGQARAPSGERAWDCVTPAVDAETAARVEALIRGERLPVQEQVRSIPVAFHVLHSGVEGDISDSRIGEQMGSLNCAFKGTGFSFQLVKTDRTNDDTWYRNCLQHESALKSALALDPAHVLNLYSCVLSSANPNLAGIARYPWDFPEDSFMHGALLSSIIVIRSNLTGYNDRGHSVVHEVGHTLGLWHTFEGGCSDGDFVADTPAQATAIRDCRVGANDSCPAAGLDDTLNFMNLGNDCRDHFTPGQAERMRAVVASERPSLGRTAGVEGG